MASPARTFLRTLHVRRVPLLGGNRCILRTYRNRCEQLDNTGVWPNWALLLWQQLRDAPSDWRRLSFAFRGRKWFHMLSCHSRPDRRGHIWRITLRHWLFRSSHCWLRCPALRLGRPRTAWPEDTAFPCSAFDTGGFRFALLHRQFYECAPGHVRRPGLDCLRFSPQP
jgi:hypothetical protein